MNLMTKFKQIQLPIDLPMNLNKFITNGFKKEVH